MNVLIFLIISMWEWFALIMLAFALYRFEIRYYVGQLVFSSFLLALFSYMVFNVFDLKIFATLIQPIVVFLFFWLLFKIPIFYAGLVVVNGYLAYCLVTSVIFYFIKQFGFVSIPSTPTSFATQSIAGLIVLFLARAVVKYRLGFSFVQHGHEIKNISGTNLKLLILTIIGYIALSSFNILYYGANKTLIVLISMIVAFGLMQYWTLKKEHEAAFLKRNKKYSMDS
ncbi:hypothetical protein FE784_26630 [Paenibacillus hemerocallicola]|uniref:Uncharacterized protein n=1 Tax=Paenibacillus hemerocallicola TaxID=1172614 RepID=A0A5C4T2F6_9BACL|nr:hypothetical protein [Paenibacillus hemerocallicola]TNJ63241.1 hypothetical protein FE784_26630 [Paenibacillus hemerocallicola]